MTEQKQTVEWLIEKYKLEKEAYINEWTFKFDDFYEDVLQDLESIQKPEADIEEMMKEAKENSFPIEQESCENWRPYVDDMIDIKDLKEILTKYLTPKKPEMVDIDEIMEEMFWEWYIPSDAYSVIPKNVREILTKHLTKKKSSGEVKKFWHAVVITDSDENGLPSEYFNNYPSVEPQVDEYKNFDVDISVVQVADVEWINNLYNGILDKKILRADFHNEIFKHLSKKPEMVEWNYRCKHCWKKASEMETPCTGKECWIRKPQAQSPVQCRDEINKAIDLLHKSWYKVWIDMS